MTNDQKHQFGIKAVTIVNELSEGNFKVIVPGRDHAIEVADKILKLLEIQLRENG